MEILRAAPQWTNSLDALSDEHLEQIFNTGAGLTEHIGAMWLGNQPMPKTDCLEDDDSEDEDTELCRFGELAHYCQTAFPGNDPDSERIQTEAMLRGICMGVGSCWRVLSPLGISQIATPAATDNFEIELDCAVLCDDNPENQRHNAGAILRFCARLLLQQPTLNKKLDLSIPYINMDSQLIPLFKQGAAIGYPYLYETYKDAIATGPANDIALIRPVKVVTYS